MIYTSAEQLIGGTPLLEVKKLEQRYGLKARLLVKLEGCNPGGSAKDRVASAMLDAAEQSGALQPGGTVIEPTSGNTGIGLALLCALRGYRAVIVMPETMSAERRRLVAAYGAELVLTDGALGMKGAIDRADEIAAATPGSIVAGQFVNPANPDAHYRTTGPELWKDADGRLDYFVAGVGTGGTLTGAGRYLKEQNPAVKLVAVEPRNSAVLSGGPAGKHNLQGIGAGFVPAVAEPSLFDEIVTVTDEDAYAAARELARCEGVLAGISSGAALWAALRVAERPEAAGKTVAVLLPDTGERYLSTAVYADV
ncbi:MAG: cysteine synthase A [Clostridia bacterium]|nr:cysteine synthase A [Clostridia bacterium]